MENKTDFYTVFRRNLRRLRGIRAISANAMSKELSLKAVKRIIDLEEGRGTPSLEEVAAIAKYLDQTIDNILYKEAIIKVEFDEK
jgi:DNA-binding XRE family transcriptional regulator